jgi:serpin B
MRATWILQRSIGLLISLGIGLMASAQTTQTKTLVEGNTAFALDLYARFSGTPGNLFFSPYSISTCLAMTYAGARGVTDMQMARVLRFGQGQAAVHSSFGELQQQLNGSEKEKGIQLDLANALWTERGEAFLPAFLKIAADDYQADVKEADFETGANALRLEINRWVARKTQDKIRDILSPGDVSSDTRLVLANAIYFKGAWARPFETNATSEQAFHISTTNQAETLLMVHVDNVKYTENNDFQAVELPYSGNNLSMLILLPRQIDALGQIEKQLSPTFLDSLLARLKKQKVKIFLPRFKLGSRYRLERALAKMGMPDAFSPEKADFSGLNGARSLYIDLVIHKAWVEVTEAGTEAAAATVVAMVAGAAPSAPPLFRADHPFIFLIRDTRSGSILFLGRITDPREFEKTSP